MKEKSDLHLIMEWCDQPDVRIERDFDPNSDHFGWWWAGFRNGPAYRAPKLLQAIEKARRGGS